jgi:hypothetical protein
MQNFIVRVLATKTYMGKDDPLVWHYRVPAISSEAAIRLMAMIHPYACGIDSLGVCD